MNEETKKIRDEFVEQCWSPSEDITSNYYDCWDAGHATAMKDVGALVEFVEWLNVGYAGMFGTNSISKEQDAYEQIWNKMQTLSRFTQNQTEKIEGE